MAAGGPRAARIAAEFGDALFVTEPRTDLIDAYRSAGGAGPRYAEVPLAWASTEEAALASAYERFRFGPTGWKVQSELPNVLNFEAATAFVRPDDLRGGFVLGPDVETHVATVREFADADYDRLALINAGPDPDGFFDFFASELSHPLRGLGG